MISPACTGKLSERSRNWLAFANVPAHLMAAQLDPLPRVNIRQIHLYQCDHRRMPVALINREGQTEWKAEVDPWGDILSKDNPRNIEQPLRLPGQCYDEESGLHYNRHRYYEPAQGRYIGQDPIGLSGGWNMYKYPLNPIRFIVPLGLNQMCHRKFDPVPAPYATHCYIKFEDGTTSSFDNNGGHPDPAPNKSGTICTEYPNPSLDECIQEAMKNCKGDNYNFTKFNCCHCVEQTMKSCGTSIPKTSWPNSPMNPGPQPGDIEAATGELIRDHPRTLARKLWYTPF